MSFAAEAWGVNAPLIDRIHALPFNRELAAGTLSAERFQRYIVQDAHYLEGFARALALLAARAPDAAAIVQFAQAAAEAIQVERSLHAGLLQRFGVSPEAFAAAEVTPVTDHYAAFLTSTAALRPYAVGVAAVLPCFWVYREVGHAIHAAAHRPNPYEAWIATYAGEAFAAAVDAAIAAADRAAERASADDRRAMHHAFTRATQLEAMFWTSAWRGDGWEFGLA